MSFQEQRLDRVPEQPGQQGGHQDSGGHHQEAGKHQAFHFHRVCRAQAWYLPHQGDRYAEGKQDDRRGRSGVVHG